MRRERCRTRANASPNVRERDTEKNLKKKKLGHGLHRSGLTDERKALQM